MPKLTILATNDLHGAMTPDKFELLMRARRQADLYFDSGDAIKSGNLGLPLKPEPVWDLLAALDCTASCPGNRESHVLKSGFEAKFRGVNHPVVCCNWFDKKGQLVFPATKEVVCQGLRVGIAGVMVPMVTRRMKTFGLSNFEWTDPITALKPCIADLNSRCDLVIALTHIGHRHDTELVQAIPGIDILLGGHSHTLLPEPQRVEHTWVCQTGSHGKYFGLYVFDSDTRSMSGQALPWCEGSLTSIKMSEQS